MRGTILRRVDKLESHLGVHGSSEVRSFTLEGLCRLYWRMDRKGFQQFVDDECPGFRAYVDAFAIEEVMSKPNQPGQTTRNSFR